MSQERLDEYWNNQKNWISANHNKQWHKSPANTELASKMTGYQYQVMYSWIAIATGQFKHTNR